MTDKEQAFINAYLLNGFNATAAAASVGYSDPNAHGATIRSRVDVAAEIDARMAEFGMGANEVLARIASHARADMTDFMDDSGTGLDLAKAKRAARLGLIKSYSFSRKSGLKIELYDAQSALRDLGKHHKLFTERHEHDFSNVSNDELIARTKAALAGGGAAGSDAGEGPEPAP
jgi:hypothetical protein